MLALEILNAELERTTDTERQKQLRSDISKLENALHCQSLVWSDEYRLVKKTESEKKYEHLALLFCEKYGIIEYKVEGNKLVFYSTYTYERRTFKSVVDLDTMKETKTQMSKYYKPYKHIGKLAVNWR